MERSRDYWLFVAAGQLGQRRFEAMLGRSLLRRYQWDGGC